MTQLSTKRQTKKLDSDTLLSIRRTHGMAAAIARAAGVSPGFVSEVLTGRKRPSARFLAALPCAFDLVTLQSGARLVELEASSREDEQKG